VFSTFIRFEGRQKASLEFRTRYAISGN
jgi:hypothetical protein